MIVRNIVYGLVGTGLLVSFAIAIQKGPFSHTPGAGDGLAGNRQPRTSRTLSSTVSATGGGSEALDVSDSAGDESAATAGREFPKPGAQDHRGPAAFQHAAPGPGQTRAVSAFVQASEEPKSNWWSNPLATLSALMSSGTGGAAGTDATSSSAGSSSGSSSTSQVKEVFFGTSAETACQPGDRQFVLNDLEILYVCVVWGGLSGSYAEQLTFVAPDGHVYQTVTVPFVTADATAPPNGIELEGRKLEVKQAGWGAKGETLVVGALPVAGTFISQRALLGLWTVEVGLNTQRYGQDNFELLQ